jgi:hypothetical protein
MIRAIANVPSGACPGMKRQETHGELLVGWG